MNKKIRCQIGDLVHIPQAVQLVDVDKWNADDPQLAIPLRVELTACPKIGIVTHTSTAGGYLRVFCEGDTWSVKKDSVYTLKGENQNDKIY
jgi:hypothetical protein